MLSLEVGVNFPKGIWSHGFPDLREFCDFAQHSHLGVIVSCLVRPGSSSRFVVKKDAVCSSVGLSRNDLSCLLYGGACRFYAHAHGLSCLDSRYETIVCHMAHGGVSKLTQGANGLYGLAC